MDTAKELCVAKLERVKSRFDLLFIFPMEKPLKMCPPRS